MWVYNFSIKKKLEIFSVPFCYLGMLKSQDISFDTILPCNHYCTVRVMYLFLVAVLILGAEKMVTTMRFQYTPTNYNFIGVTA